MITKKQQQVLEYIEKYQKKNKYSPSLEEIQKQFKLASVSTAHYYIQQLKKKGMLSKEGSHHRAISVLPSHNTFQIPILGTISAGPVSEAIENLNGYIMIPENEIKSPEKFYALKVAGDSMIDDGVYDGDTVIIRQQSYADNGSMVVAVIDNNQTTLKRIYREKKRIRLQPANQNLLPFYRTEVEIRGVVEKIIRNPNFKIQESSNQPILISNHQKEKPNTIYTKQEVKQEKNYSNNNKIKIYHGDALDILDKEIDYKVDMIYLDPPFATGRDFKYQATSKEIEFSDKWNGDSYEKWLDSLIFKLKKTLEKDGNLFFHISAELSAIPQKILQKHFKKVEPIFWKKAHGKNTVKNKLGSVIDIIFRASEDKSYFKLIYEPLDEYYFENSYRNKDKIGLYALGSLVHDKTRSGHKYKINHNGVCYESLYGWKKNKEEMLKLIKEDKIHFGKATNGNPPRLYKKLYKHECKGKPLSNLWTDIAYITRNEQDKRLYPTQKPVELLKRLIEIGCKENGTVLDPVAGSGTTGAAAIGLNRKVVLIDKNKEAIKIIKDRLKI